MSKTIEGMIECPFYVKEGNSFISCEGIINKTAVTHRFNSNEEKIIYEHNFCCANGGKRCPHYRNVSILYERGVRS